MTKIKHVNILGKTVRVVFHPNHTFIGLEGKVILETENMIHLLIDGRRIVKIPKMGIKLEILNYSKENRIITYKELKGSIIRRLSKI